MLILKSFQDSLHDCFAQEFGFIFYPVPVTVDTQRTHFSVVKHQGKPVASFEPFFLLSAAPHLILISG
jgi:hypothetical protein